MKQCSICNQPFTEYGNDARPVNDGRCCDYCDCLVVLPIRIMRMSGTAREKYAMFGYRILTEMKRRRGIGNELREDKGNDAGQSPVV
jgi:hypothetical protein